MAFVVRHPITAQVDDRAMYLRYLIEEYPSLLNNWERRQEQEFARIAKEDSDGDSEIEHSIYMSLLNAFDDDDARQDLFYQSLLIMCFSYYESCIALLSKQANAKESIKAICNTKNIVLSEETKEAIEYIQGDINDLRNNICHNNFGTFRKVDTLKRIASENIGIDYTNDTISITKPTLIISALDKMHMVLHELCEKLGYKSKKI